MGGVVKRLARIIQELPVVLPAGLAAFSAASIMLLLTGYFYLPLLLGFGLAAAGATMWLAYLHSNNERLPGSGRKQLIIDIAVLLGIVAWAGWNIPFSSQHLLTDRDPATYAVSGAWLITHHSLLIPKPTLVSNVPSIFTNSYGFGNSLVQTGDVYAQGGHLLPALLGTVGKIAGLRVMLQANVIFGAFALFAFYGFMRKLVRGGLWAGFAVVALAVSMPIIYFSRDTYTEPLTLLFIFSTLSLLTTTQQQQRVSTWALAGLTAGTTALLRVDDYTFLIALTAYAVLYLAFAPKDQRVLRTQQIIALAIPSTMLSILGWLDVSRLSSGYYHDLHSQITSQFIGIGVVGVVGIASVAILWSTTLQHWLQQQTKKPWLPRLVASLLALFFIALSLRAGWFLVLALAGKATAIPVTTYADATTMIWIVWYIGPIFTFSGVLAFCYGWSRVLMGRLFQLLPLLLVVSAYSALYLLDPHISPDQIWASRRFLPVIFPGFIALGTLVLQHSYTTIKLKSLRFRITNRVVASVAVLAMLGPMLTSLPFWGTRPFAELALFDNLCSTVPSNAIVVWVGAEAGFAIQPTQAVCGAESVGTTDSGAQLRALLPKLQRVAILEHKKLFIAAATNDAGMLPSTGRSIHIPTLKYVELEHTYKRFPIRTISHSQGFIVKYLF